MESSKIDEINSSNIMDTSSIEMDFVMNDDLIRIGLIHFRKRNFSSITVKEMIIMLQKITKDYPEFESKKFYHSSNGVITETKEIQIWYKDNKEKSWITIGQ